MFMRRGEKISIVKKTLFISIIFLMFLSMGSCFAGDSSNVFEENQNQLSSNDLNNDNYNNIMGVYSEKVNTTIESDNLTKYFKNDSQFVVKLVDAEGNPLNNMTISFHIRGSVYDIRTNESGLAKLDINLIPGEYTITSVFKGTETYSSFNVTNSIKVLSTIEGDNIVKYFRNGTQYYATILDAQGNPLVNTNVSLNINGIFYVRTTDANGIATLDINLNPNDYIITVHHPNGQMYSNTIKVLNTVIGNDIVKYFRNGTQYYVTILDAQGNPLANTNVSMNINGIFYVRTTDANGVACLDINLNPNTYIITVSHPITELMKSNIINVLKMETQISASDLVVLVDNSNKVFTITYKDAHGNPIADLPVFLNFNNNVNVYMLTDANGRASLAFNGNIGNYIIKYGFDGSAGYSAMYGEKTIKIVNSTTSLIGNDLEFTYGENKSFSVTLKDLDGNPLANKIITFVINNVQYNKTTDINGVASIHIGLNPNVYDISYSYSKNGEMDYNSGHNTVTVKKQTLNLEGNDLVMLPDDNSAFEVLLTQNGNPIANKNIVFTVNNVNYNRVTDSQGKASLLITLGVGYYTITYKLANDVIYTANEGNNKILVNGTILSGYPDAVSNGEFFNVLLKDAYGNPIANEDIVFTISGVNYTAKTNTNGIASLKISLNQGEYLVIYTLTSSKYAENKGQVTLTVTNPIDISSIIAASKVVRDYIINNKELPHSVTVEGKVYSNSEFLYLLLVATINLNEGNFEKITPLILENPTGNLNASNLGDLYKAEYLLVASNIINTMMLYGQAPDLAESSLGNMAFEGLVYSYARIVAFYAENNNVMPAYVTVKALKVSSSSSHLNDPYNGEDLSKYLVATTRCQVDDPAIQAKAQELTAGLTDPLAKALAIFEFCRYEIGYAFYFDSRYGAVGSLSRSAVNCVDGTHLFIALCRAADLPARYVHGDCQFRSSGWVGHVWAQVLIGDTWIVADTSSAYNSFGEVVNWGSYSLKGKYPSISF